MDKNNNLQNLHTHSTFCDGKDAPEEMVCAAIEKGFSSIGFSGHSYMSYSPFYVKKGDHTEEYKKEVNRLKEKYKDKIKIYLGLEVDMYSMPDMTGYDYLIGTVHYLKQENDIFAIDLADSQMIENMINERFDGNSLKYVKAYYSALSCLTEYGKFDILGHFDLITKHNEKKVLFDVTSKEYKNAFVEAAECLSGKIPFFEVNTGAIARGYRTSPYPSAEIIKELKRLGFGAVITSDCHDKEKLDCGFSDAAELLKACGFKEKYILSDNGFCAAEL